MLDPETKYHERTFSVDATARNLRKPPLQKKSEK